MTDEQACLIAHCLDEQKRAIAALRAQRDSLLAALEGLAEDYEVAAAEAYGDSHRWRESQEADRTLKAARDAIAEAGGES